MFKSICLTAALLFSLTTPEAKAVEIKDPENTLVIELRTGEVVIEMLPDVAPLHVERIKTLAREGEYDGVAFHRGDGGLHGPDRRRAVRRHERWL